MWHPRVTAHHSFNTHSVVRPAAHSITLGEGSSAGESVSDKSRPGDSLHTRRLNSVIYVDFYMYAMVLDWNVGSNSFKASLCHNILDLSRTSLCFSLEPIGACWVSSVEE